MRVRVWMAGMSLATAHESRIKEISSDERPLPAAPLAAAAEESELVVMVVVPSADVLIVTVVVVIEPCFCII